MKKIDNKRLLLCLLLNLVMGSIFLIVSYIFLNSSFSLNYIHGSDNIEISKYSSVNESFEDSELYTEIYTKQLQDVIEYTAARAVLETDGEIKKTIVDICKTESGIDYDTNKSIIYSADNLIKWGRQGFTYKSESFTLREFLNFYDSDMTLEEIRSSAPDGVYYISADYGVSEIVVNMLVPAFDTIDGKKDITAMADNWMEYFFIRDSIIKTASQLSDYYDIYRNGSNLYKNYDTNLKYIIRFEKDGITKTFSNYYELNTNINNISDEALNEIFADKRNYLIYLPEKLEYLSFSKVDESDLYTYFRLYSDELTGNARIWAFVDDDYELEHDLFAQAFRIIDERNRQLTIEIFITVILLIIWIILFIYLLLKAGKNKNGGNYLMFWDSIWIEIYVALFIFFISLTVMLFDRGIDGYNRSLVLQGDVIYYTVYLLLGIANSVVASLLFFSFARRIRSRTLLSHSLFASIYKGVKFLQNKVEGSRIIFVNTVLPFILFISINFVSLLFVFIGYRRRNIVLIAIFVGLTILFDLYVAFRLVKKSKDRNLLFEAISNLNEGNIEYKINTKELLNSNVEFANSVNNLGNNIKNAVMTSMKDEKMKSDLITNVSHDLKTPLTSIINYVGLLRDENITEEPALSYINTLENKSIRLKRLLEDLIEASRLSSGNVEVNLTEIAIWELFHQVVGEYVDKLDEKKLTVIYTGEAKSNIWADGRLMWRIMENLFGNILKYAMEGTRIYIDFEEVDDQIYISIKNVSKTPITVQGTELTEKFIRGDSSRSSEGSGLGLFIAKNLTTSQGGSFEVIADGDLFKILLSFKKVE